MPTALVPLTRIAFGLESEPGTPATATAVIPATAEYEEQAEFYRPTHPYGVRVAGGGAGVIVARGSSLKVETELTAEEILWPLLTGLGQATPAGTEAPYTWTFAPALGAAPTVKTATAEVVRTDGVTNHYVAIAPYCITKGFSIEFSASEIATLSWEMEGLPRAAGAPSATAQPYGDRAPLPGALARVFVDDSWAALGTTQLVGSVRSGSVEVETGLALARTVDGRADLGPSHHVANMLAAKLSLVMELNETGAQHIQRYRNNSLAFVRVAFQGPPVGGQPRSVTIDGCWRVAGSPKFQADGEQVTIGLDLELVQDPTSGNALQVVVVNGRSSV
jgi:hypothetical protein